MELIRLADFIPTNVAMSDPLPIKFPEPDDAWIEYLRTKTGLKKSEVVRRGLRLLAARVAREPGWNWVEETAIPLVAAPPKVAGYVPPLEEQSKRKRA